MSLQDWHKAGWLTEHRSSRREIADLLGIADRDLVDCQNKGLSPDWRLNIAYNAALQLATAALAAAGYRAGRESHHYRIIQSLAYTLQTGAGVITQLEQFRKKRNLVEYERAGSVSEHEVATIINLARQLRGELRTWLKKHHPKLV